MINEVKDSVANATTLAGSGAVIMGWNEALTMVLVLTGIVLNVVRIIATKKSNN